MADHFGKCVKMLLRNYRRQLTYKVGTLFFKLFDSLVRTLYAKFQGTPTSLFSDPETLFAFDRRVKPEALREDLRSFQSVIEVFLLLDNAQRLPFQVTFDLSNM